MDWLKQINSDTVVVVPTHGLQHSLQEHYALEQQALGNVVWETPQILVWDNLVQSLYEQNKQSIGRPKIAISDAQSFIVWQQVVSKLKKEVNAFVLLNEAQTASAVQRSWRLMHKWRIDRSKLADRKDEDSQVFLELCDMYQARLDQSAWIDKALLESQVVEYVASETADVLGLPQRFVFAYFDLETSTQRQFKTGCGAKGVTVERQEGQQQTSQQQFISYESPIDELEAVFTEARNALEANPEQRLGIVVADLAQRRQEVAYIAQQVFYPDRSPIENQQKGRAYRFSLGHSLVDIPYIASQLRLLNLLKPSFNYQDLSFVLRNAWVPIVGNYPEQTMQLVRALSNSRVVYWTWEKVLEKWQELQEKTLKKEDEFVEYDSTLDKHPLTELLKNCVSFCQQIAADDSETEQATEITAFTQANRDWQHTFSEWLQVFDWQANELDSYHYQAQKSWLTVLETFASLDQVQPPIGLVKALRQIQSLSKDAVFMRQARNEPILISGVLEAVGREVDQLFITGMNDSYPVPLGGDPFIPNELLAAQQYPFAQAASEYEYEQQKMQSLMTGAKSLTVSYSKLQDDGEAEPSTLFQTEFNTKQFKEADKASSENEQAVELESYQDMYGEKCRDSRYIQGGSAIFETQSNCPFKAYRVMIDEQEEPEFGLDAKDAGNVLHDLLEIIWRELGSSSTLALESTDIRALATRHVNDYIARDLDNFKFDRKALLKLESQRLVDLLEQWLSYERDLRKIGFSVVETEKSIKTEFAKIPIKLKIDRIDRLDDGSEFIIDYKSGNVKRTDWFGERPKRPQLPLYALAYEEHRKQINNDRETSAIALAQVKSNDIKMEGFAKGDDIVAGVNNVLMIERKKTPLDWNQQLHEWHQSLSALADEFLTGNAVVDPVDKMTCDYCDLTSVCRIHQMRNQSSDVHASLTDEAAS